MTNGISIGLNLLLVILGTIVLVVSTWPVNKWVVVYLALPIALMWTHAVGNVLQDLNKGPEWFKTTCTTWAHPH